MIESRLLRLVARQRMTGVDCVALVPGPNMRYLCGLTLFMSERPIVAFLPVDEKPAILLPGLEAGRVGDAMGDGVDLYPYTDEEGYPVAFERAVSALDLDGKRCAVEHLCMRVMELRALERVAPDAQFVSLEETLPGLRVIKDGSEVDAMRRAIAIAEEALRKLIAASLLGMTERQIAARLKQELVTAGGDAVAFVIVVAGPNSANPHAGPSDRPVQTGDLLTIDCGVLKDGYPSDITRTFVLGEASTELVDIYCTVQRANEAGRLAARAGVAAQDVDRATRGVIEDAGYGQYFIRGNRLRIN